MADSQVETPQLMKKLGQEIVGSTENGVWVQNPDGSQSFKLNEEVKSTSIPHPKILPGGFVTTPLNPDTKRPSVVTTQAGNQRLEISEDKK